MQPIINCFWVRVQLIFSRISHQLEYSGTPLWNLHALQQPHAEECDYLALGILQQNRNKFQGSVQGFRIILVGKPGFEPVYAKIIPHQLREIFVSISVVVLFSNASLFQHRTEEINVDLSKDNSLVVDISDALSERDKVRPLIFKASLTSIINI